MNKEKYLEFIRTNEELSERIELIFKHALKDARRIPFIDRIEFEEDIFIIKYEERIGCPESINLPSHLLYVNDWRSQYDIFEASEKEKERVQKLEKERKETEESKRRERALYEKLKEKFEKQ